MMNNNDANLARLAAPPFPPIAVLGPPPMSMAPPPTAMAPPPTAMAPPPLYHSFVPPPPFNTALPPPIVHPFPPPPISTSHSSANSVTISDPDYKFKCFKQNWEERYNKIKKDRRKPVYIKVSVIRQKLVECCNLINQLESLANCLQLTHKSLSEEEWNNHSKEAAKIQAKLSDLIEEINNPDMLERMKRTVLLRRKKRDYKKRKLKEWQRQKREAKFYSEQEHRRIDLWLENMKDQVSRAKREEDIKREADLVLSDVTTKKAEAKRMLNLLNALAKLRAARAHNLSSKKSTTEYENNAFTEVIDRLKKMWLDQFNGYKIEEEGLKVMLGHAEEERTSLEAAKLRKNLKSWYHGIFGTSQSTDPQSFDELVQIRRDWDKFICRKDALMASSIPVGWVLPSEPSSQEWAALLQNIA